MELVDTDVLIDVQRGLSMAADLSHGLGPFDALIAATAVGHGIVLNTFNDRHDRMFPGLTTVRPSRR